MNRRIFLWSGAILSMDAAALTRAAPEIRRADKVYLDYTQQELDDAYSDARWAPNMRQLLEQQGEAGRKARALHPPVTASYGAGAAERLDIFSPGQASAGRPAMIFLHGGNWRVGTKESVSFLAPTFIDHGAIFIAPEFDSLPRNTLAGMVDQCRRAVAWVASRAVQLGVDPQRIHVGGHSAGGHLAAMVLTTDWTAFGMPAVSLKGGLVLSGLCDLEPAVMAAGNRHLRLTPRERVALSPVHALRSVPCPVLVAWGSGDSPEFQRQGALMAERLRQAGRLAGTIVLPGVNHFEILDALGTSGSRLAAATLELMGQR